MAFFIVLGTCLVALAIALNVSWIIFHWRQVVPLVLGIIFFGLIIAGLVVNTIFLVREVRRNEQQENSNKRAHRISPELICKQNTVRALKMRHYPTKG